MYIPRMMDAKLFHFHRVWLDNLSYKMLFIVYVLKKF
jgi:hypothetical protein